MCDTNVVEISGTIAEEPVYRTTKNDQGMSTFSIKVQRIVAWGDQANVVRDSYHEGEKIGVKGHLRKQYYMTQDGTKRYNLQIVAEDIYRPKS